MKKLILSIKSLAMLIAFVLGTAYASAQCTASFTIDSLVNGTVYLTNTSNVNNALWAYDYGDGSASTQSGSHTYNSNGVYTICIYVLDSITQCQDSMCQSIVVTGTNGSPNCNLIANFSYVNNGNGNVTFSDNSTGGSNSLDYFWNFGDGNFGNGTNPNHTYGANGSYTVTLQVYDMIDSTCFDNFTLVIPIGNATNCNITAGFTTAYNGNNNYTFTSTATGSPNYEYWDFGDGNNAFGPVQNHTYATNGTYLVTLIAGDSLTTCADTAMFYVQPNSINCNVVAGFTSVDNGGGNFSFTNTTTGSTNLAYYWNFGDGNGSSTNNPNHTYGANGTYVVSMWAFDLNDSTCYDFTTTTLVVTGTSNNIPCNASFVIVPDSNNTNNVLVYNTSTGNNLSYFWDFGDGNTSTQQYPQYTYSSPGPFELCLTVTDSNNMCSSMYCDSIWSFGVVLKQSGFTINVVSPTATSIEEEKELFTGVSLFPNPVNENLNISFNLENDSDVLIQITDLAGQVIDVIQPGQLNSGQNTVRWNASILANGVYLVNINGATNKVVKKFIVNK